MTNRDYVIIALILVVLAMGIFIYNIGFRDTSSEVRSVQIISNYDTKTGSGEFDVKAFLSALPVSLSSYNAYISLEKTINFQSGFTVLYKLYRDKKISAPEFNSLTAKYLGYYYQYKIKNDPNFFSKLNINSAGIFKKLFNSRILQFDFSVYPTFDTFIEENLGNDTILILSPYPISEIRSYFAKKDQKEVQGAYGMSDASGIENILELQTFANAKSKQDCASLTLAFPKMLCDGYYK